MRDTIPLRQKNSRIGVPNRTEYITNEILWHLFLVFIDYKEGDILEQQDFLNLPFMPDL